MKNKLQILVTLTLFAFGCEWKHDGMYVKDKSGNVYLLKSSGIRHESYDLKEVDVREIDSLRFK